MIDFRYHLVSIVAVFLALAIGIFVGVTAIQPTALKGLDKASRLERQEILTLQQEKKALIQQVAGDQMFAQAAAGRLLAHLLDGQRVVIVTAPGADGQTVDGVTTALRQAGAGITETIVLQQAFFDTSASTESSLNTLAQRLAPAGMTPGSQAQQGGAAPITGQQEAVQVLAAALVSRDGPGLSAGQAQTILAGFAGQGLVGVNPSNGTSAAAPGTMAVVIIPASPPAGGDSDPANSVLLALAQQLQRAGRGAVLAGSLAGSGPGSAIDEVTSGNAGIQLSTVDNADTGVGQILVAQALGRLLTGQKPASFGVQVGAVPSPAPTPSATPSASPSVTPARPTPTASHRSGR